MEQVLLLLTPLVEAYAGKWGAMVQVITIIGTLRLLLKPAMSVIQAVVLITPSKSDDDLPAKIMGSKAYKISTYILDWFASIKLPKKDESGS